MASIKTALIFKFLKKMKMKLDNQIKELQETLNNFYIVIFAVPDSLHPENLDEIVFDDFEQYIVLFRKEVTLEEIYKYLNVDFYYKMRSYFAHTSIGIDIE